MSSLSVVEEVVAGVVLLRVSNVVALLLLAGVSDVAAGISDAAGAAAF